MATDTVTQVEAIVLKLEPGDIALLRLPEDVLQDEDTINAIRDSVVHALDVTGNTDKVAVLLTADAISLEVIRFDDGGPHD